MRARLWGHGHGIHAGQFHQPMRQFVDHGQRTLHGFPGLQWMDICKSWQTRHFLVKARIVLHCAGAERKRPQINRIVLAAEARIVAHHFGLGQSRQRRRLGPHKLGQPGHRLAIGKVEIDTAFRFGTGSCKFENQRLFKMQTPITAYGWVNRRALAIFTHGRAPARSVGSVHAGTPS